MKVSVTLGSSRPGGIDVSFYGLARQTYRDWELVFVDARYHRRHAQVLDAWDRACAEAGTRVPLIHVPNHRNQSSPWQVNCAGFNTGFMLAAGENVVMLLDYGWCPPDWLERHVRAHEGGRRIVLAPHDYRPLPAVRTRDGAPPWLFYEGHIGRSPEAILAERDRYDEISIFAEPFDPQKLGDSSAPPHCDPKMFMPEGPIAGMPFHTKNESFPTDVALDVNGMDEHFDRMGGPGDPEFGYRLERAGLQPWLTHAVVACPNPRWVMPNPNAASHYDKLLPGHEWRGCYLDGERYYTDSNAEGRRRARNPYELRERREAIWHWRDESQKREAVIPYVEVPDAEYWR